MRDAYLITIPEVAYLWILPRDQTVPYSFVAAPCPLQYHHVNILGQYADIEYMKQIDLSYLRSISLEQCSSRLVTSQAHSLTRLFFPFPDFPRFSARTLASNCPKLGIVTCVIYHHFLSSTNLTSPSQTNYESTKRNNTHQTQKITFYTPTP